MTIPFFDLKRQYDEIRDRVEPAVIEVIQSTKYVEGDAVKRFEKALSEYLLVKHVITCNSGTDALRISLQAAGVNAGDEVITTPFTFYATAEAIAQIGAVPVFADIMEDSLNIDPVSIRSRITPKTKAIIPVHIFGMPADMDEINSVAQEYHLKVIEDACQAIGATYKGRSAGSIGDIGCFSFYPTKNLGGFGDGGMITTNDDRMAICLNSLKSHGAGKNGALAYEYLTGEKVEELSDVNSVGNDLYDPCKYYNYLIGGNSRLDSIQAAVLLEKLRILDRKNERRSEIAAMYIEGLKSAPVRIPQCEDDDHKSCWHQFAILVDQKENFIAYMAEKGIGTGAFYPVPLHLQKAFKYLGYKAGTCPVAESICTSSVCLPIFPELMDAEVDCVISAVKDYFN